MMGCDVMEVYSPVRVAEVCKKHGLVAGQSLDLRTGWDLTDPEHQKKAIEILKKDEPTMLICSPPCTKFSRLQELNCYVHGPEWEAQFLIDRDKAHAHIKLSILLIRMQMNSGR